MRFRHRMRKIYVIAAVLVIILFFFVPFDRTTFYNPAGTGQKTGWLSPSFAIFQCGVAVGDYMLLVPNGSVYGLPQPWWVSNSFWNCEFPHL